MTRSLIIEVTAVEAPLPPSKAFSHRLFELHAVSMGQSAAPQTSVDLSVRFDGLAEGTYTVQVTDVATDGSPLAPPVSGEVTIGDVSAAHTYMATSGLSFLVV